MGIFMRVIVMLMIDDTIINWYLKYRLSQRIFFQMLSNA